MTGHRKTPTCEKTRKGGSKKTPLMRIPCEHCGKPVPLGKEAEHVRREHTPAYLLALT